MSSRSEGHCVDSLVIPTSPPPPHNYICDQFLTQEMCTSYSDCSWKLNNNTCACTFTGCSCSDPSAGAEKSAPYDYVTMVMIITPLFSVIIMVRRYTIYSSQVAANSLGPFSPNSWQLVIAVCCFLHRRAAARLIERFCPGVIVAAFAIKDDALAGAEHRRSADAEEQSVAVEPHPVDPTEHIFQCAPLICAAPLP